MTHARATLCALGILVAVAATAAADGKVVGSTVTAGDRFGYAVALDGSTAVVGAPGATAEAGAAFVFRRDVTSWGEVAVLGPQIASDAFGKAVAIAGDVVLVGAPGDDQLGTDAGIAYLYGRDQGGSDAWGLVATLSADLPHNQDYFGDAVGLDGDQAIVGAYGRQAAYVFDRNQGGADSWGLVAVLTASDPASGDRFGISVGIAGDIAVVGAEGDDDYGSSSGSAYVFARDQGGAEAWGQVTKLNASNEIAQDFFGVSVAVDADVIVVGADGHDTDPLDNCGAAYVFARDHGGANAWGQVAQLGAVVDGSARFGHSVSVRGSAAVIGAYLDEVVTPDQGRAFVFDRYAAGPESWWPIATLAAHDPQNSDYLGFAVAVSGAVALAGAYQDDDAGAGSGSAYFFEGLAVTAIFADGFELGSAAGWSFASP